MKISQNRSIIYLFLIDNYFYNVYIHICNTYEMHQNDSYLININDVSDCSTGTVDC